LSPMLLGIPGDNTFSNYQEANRTFWRQTVLPLVQRSTAALSEWLTPAYGSTLSLAPDLDDIPALSMEQDALWTRLNAANFITTEEKRTAAGYGGAGHITSDQKFDPNQPRDGQGRWTLVGDGGGYPINLLAEEARGGHTYAKHIGKSKEFLLRRLQEETFQIGPFEVGLLRAGSFPSLEAATKLVNSTLSQNQALVDQVAEGKIGGARLVADFNSSTGFEAYKATTRSQAIVRDTNSVEMFIRHDKSSPNGFTVFTAFPMNRD